MRKLLLLPVILLCILVVFQSCSKQSSTEAVVPSTNIINATIAPNGSYLLPIDNSGIVAVSISKQASHFQVSQTELDSKSGFIVYKYIPAVDYRGTDEVLLSSTKTSVVTGSGCINTNHDSNTESTVSSTSYTTVKLNITN